MRTQLALLVLSSATVLGAATGAGGAIFADRTQAQVQVGAERPAPQPNQGSSPRTPNAEATPISPIAAQTFKTAPKKNLAPLPLDQLVITPGAIGPVQADMSKSAALATGYFDAGPNRNPAICDTVVPLSWKKPYQDALGLDTTDTGDILSIYVRGPGPRTSAGYGVGTTWGQLKQGITEGPDDFETSTISAAYIYDPATDGWIAFGFDVPTDELTDETKVSFMELDKGRKPAYEAVGGC